MKKHSLASSVCLVFLMAKSSLGAADTAAFGPNVELRGSLANSRTQFEKSKSGHVVFMGGSITEMDGYRPMVCDLLRKRFPSTRFRLTNAGIASTCSTTGAFRMETDVLSDGQVDLLFIEFAVNDDQDAAHSRTECIRGLEGIIRHARNRNTNVDIVVTYFVNEGMLTTIQSGRVPLTIEAHEAVARHYSIPTINLAKEVAEEITSGKLTWSQYGGVHPAPFGNALCARMIDELFNRAWDTPAANTSNSSPMPSALDPLSYEKGRFIDPKEADFKQGWSLGIPDWQQLPGSKRSRFTSIPILFSTESNSAATLKFTGTAIGAYVVAGPDAGIVEASIDGGPAQSVNLLHRFSAGLHYPRTVMFATDLKPGPHLLSVRVSEKTWSSDHAIRIMQFVAN